MPLRMPLQSNLGRKPSNLCFIGTLLTAILLQHQLHITLNNCFSTFNVSHLRSRVARKAKDTKDILPLVHDQFQAEALRCWMAGSDGKVNGFIADMLQKGTNAGSSKCLEDQDVWLCPAGAKSRRNAVELKERHSYSIRNDDFSRAMDFFQTPSGLLLDIGCGEGIYARRFARGKYFEYVMAVDISWSELEVCRYKAQEEGLLPTELLLARADARHLPLCSGSVDSVLWSMGLHIIEDPSQVLREIQRVLKPDSGRLVASGYVGRIPGASDAEGLKALANQAGLSDVVVSQTDGGVRYMLQATR